MLLVENAKKVVIDNGWLSMTPSRFEARSSTGADCKVSRPGNRFTGWAIRLGACSVSFLAGLAYRSDRTAVPIWVTSPGPAHGLAKRPRSPDNRAASGLIATRDTQMFHLPLPRIDEIVADDPGAWRWLALVTVGHLDTAISACDDLMLRDHVKRCIAVLLRLGGCRHASP